VTESIKRGKLIWIEGTDATGKSTQVERISNRLEAAGHSSIAFHEPDGVPIASAIRDVIKNGSLERDALTNLLLFSASRRENWIQRGQQALLDGTWVLNARTSLSTEAYQGDGEGLDSEIIQTVTRIATGDDYLSPDLVIVLDIEDEDERTRRITERGPLENPDTFESRDALFQEKVRQGYRRLARENNYPVISAKQPIDKVTDDIWDHIQPLL